jgi:glycosyltransferase involved in cell wall biosynthesis
MRILFDGHLSSIQLTGIGRYIYNIIHALVSIDQKNEYFLMIRSDLGKDHPLVLLNAPNLVKIKTLFRGLSLSQHLLSDAIIEKNGINVYHHPHFDLPFFISCPSVVTIHDLIYLHRPEYFNKYNKLKQCIIRFTMKHTLSRATKILAVSKFTKSDVCRMFNLRPDRIEVIYHGTGTEIRNESESYTDRLKPYRPYILFVGERRPHKNIINLIKAFETLLEQNNTPLTLLIIGKSYDNYSMPEEYIMQRKLENKIRLLGYVNETHLNTLYENAELLILPSYCEGFGLPILEAMQHRIPVIGANAGAIPEIMGNAGLLIDPDNINDIKDKIIRLIEDHALRSELINRGLKQIQKYSWEVAAYHTLKIYNEVGN